MRHVVLVCGPPCSGKSTYVRAHLAPGDYVLDADTMARRFGSPKRWLHADAYAQAAQREWWAQVQAVAAMEDGTAWVIRCAPRAEERAQLREVLRADEVVLLTPAAEVLVARARRRPEQVRTIRSIQRWHQRYTQTSVDADTSLGTSEEW